MTATLRLVKSCDIWVWRKIFKVFQSWNQISQKKIHIFFFLYKFANKIVLFEEALQFNNVILLCYNK